MVSVFAAAALAVAPPTGGTVPIAVRPSVSGEVAVAARPSANAIAAADRLLVAMNYERMMSQMIDQIQAGMAANLKAVVKQRAGATPPQGLIDKVAQVLNAHFEKYLRNNADLKRSTALLYAAHFTQGELDHMAELYKDPVMQKWAERTPKLMGEMVPLIAKFNELHRGELEAELMQAVKTYIDSHQSEFTGDNAS